MSSVNNIETQPLTQQNWDDFETLFGPRGACAGCWCMYWYVSHKEFDSQKGEFLKSLMKKKVWHEKQVPGLLLFVNGIPAGWIAMGPRNQYFRLTRSRILRPVDDQEVWSIVCFFVHKNHRRLGLTLQLIDAAIKFCEQKGAQIIEAYPEDPKKPEVPDTFAYTGFASTFQKAGFVEVARRSPTRPIMHFYTNK
jgi:GNAT superfamily N-acetyltransferase